VGEIGNSGTGTSQITLSSLGPSSAAGTGTGSGYSVASTSSGGANVTNAGQSAGIGAVAGLAYYGDLLGYSTSTGYSLGYGGLTVTPGSSSGGDSSSGKGGSGKKKSSGSGNSTTPPASIPSFAGYSAGASGGAALGYMASYGVFGTGSTYGAFAGQSVGAMETPLGSASGGTGAAGRQEGSGYAVGGGFQMVNVGSSGSDFVSGLANRFF
jgi:hypothetical protein